MICEVCKLDTGAEGRENFTHIPTKFSSWCTLRSGKTAVPKQHAAHPTSRSGFFDLTSLGHETRGHRIPMATNHALQIER